MKRIDDRLAWAEAKLAECRRIALGYFGKRLRITRKPDRTPVTIADRTIEHLGISDTAIVKIRRLLLQTLKDHAAGKPLPGADPRSFRVRSARYKASSDKSFAETMEQHVRIDALVSAE